MKSGYVKRATLVAEAKIGRALYRDEEVHHRDKNRENDNPDNLEVLTKMAHANLHAAERRMPPRARQPEHPSNRRVRWPPDAVLTEMRQRMTLQAIADTVGCSNQAVHRRIARILAAKS